MSYVPPHKRHGTIATKASSLPPSLLTKTKIIKAKDCISRWFLVASEESNNKNNKLQLVPVSAEWKRDAEEKPLFTLDKRDLGKVETPWLCVAEKVEDDLVLGFDRAKKMMQVHGSVGVKLRLITRFGKVVFDGVSSSETKSTLQKSKKSFNTNVPNSYFENIEYRVLYKMIFCVEETKELYHVKVSDNTRPDITISCKCMLDKQHKRLNFYKAELNALRHLILDISCLDQDLDMRLNVDSKRILTNLSENEIKNLIELVDSAVMDQNVKGGLKWPFGKSSCANRFSVCGVWHTVTTTYINQRAGSDKNQTLRLQVREADRFDFRTGIGATSREVNLRLKTLSTKLSKEEEVERKCVSDMLKDCLKSVWDFLKAV